MAYCRISTAQQLPGGVTLGAQQRQIVGYAMVKGCR